MKSVELSLVFSFFRAFCSRDLYVFTCCHSLMSLRCGFMHVKNVDDSFNTGFTRNSFFRCIFENISLVKEYLAYLAPYFVNFEKKILYLKIVVINFNNKVPEKKIFFESFINHHFFFSTILIIY